MNAAISVASGAVDDAWALAVGALTPRRFMINMIPDRVSRSQPVHVSYPIGCDPRWAGPHGPDRVPRASLARGGNIVITPVSHFTTVAVATPRAEPDGTARRTLGVWLANAEGMRKRVRRD